MGTYTKVTDCQDRKAYQNEAGSILTVDKTGTWVVMPELDYSQCFQNQLVYFKQFNYKGKRDPTDEVGYQKYVHYGTKPDDFVMDGQYEEDYLRIYAAEEQPEPFGEIQVNGGSWCCQSHRVSWTENNNIVTFQAPFEGYYDIGLYNTDLLVSGSYDSLVLVTPDADIPVKKGEYGYFNVCLLKGEVIWVSLLGQSARGQMNATWSINPQGGLCQRQEHVHASPIDVENDDPELHLQQLEKVHQELGQIDLPDVKRNQFDFAYRQFEDVWKE